MESVMAKEIENTLPKIGYVYHYPKMDEPTDKFRLDIFISSIPTEKHFDVLRCQVFVKNRKGTIERLTISHPWVFEKEADVCAGVVIMEDRKGKKEEAFTFGGRLRIDEQEMQTICVLTSSAPILEISGASPLHTLFIEELEIVLAKRQAAFLNQIEYETRSCKVEPFELYRACLRELIEEFEKFHNKDEESIELLVYLNSQEHRLSAAGLTNTPAPTLDEIFEV
jgi:hypothetical protein